MTSIKVTCNQQNKIASDNYEQYISDSVKDDESIDTNTKRNIHMFSFRNPEGCPLYEQIIEGKKTVEGRKNSPIYQTIKVGDILLLSDRSKGILECAVTYVNLYADVNEYLAAEGLGAVFGDPISCRAISNIQDGANIYREFVPDKQIVYLKEKYGQGFMGIGIKFLHEYKRYFITLDEIWLSSIRDGSKTINARLNSSWVTNLKPYDMIEYTKNNTNKLNVLDVLVIDVKHYKNFNDLFDTIGADKIFPDKNNLNIEEEQKGLKLGVVAIFIKILN